MIKPRYLRLSKRFNSSDVSSILNEIDTTNASTERLPTGIQLEFLGTSSAASTITRNVSSVAFNFGINKFSYDALQMF